MREQGGTGIEERFQIAGDAVPPSASKRSNKPGTKLCMLFPLSRREAEEAPLFASAKD
jgi:hypothetical protein